MISFRETCIYAVCFIDYNYLVECLQKKDNYIPQKTFFDNLIHEHLIYTRNGDIMNKVFYSVPVQNNKINHNKYNVQINRIKAHAETANDYNYNKSLPDIPEIKHELCEFQKHNIKWMSNIEQNGLTCEYDGQIEIKTNGNGRNTI